MLPIPATARWSRSAAFTARRDWPSRSANSQPVTTSPSGPSFAGPQAASRPRSSTSRIVPRPRRSQNRNRRGFATPARSTTIRTWSAEGGSTTSMSPVIRGSITSHLRPPPAAASAIWRTTRLPRRVTAAISAPASCGPSDRGSGLTSSGRTGPRGNVTRPIRRPMIPASPRHIVSTSGSSGMAKTVLQPPP